MTDSSIAFVTVIIVIVTGYIMSYKDYLNRPNVVNKDKIAELYKAEIEALGDCSKWDKKDMCLQILVGIHNNSLQLLDKDIKKNNEERGKTSE